MASIMALRHPALAAPLAVGEWQGQAWTVEPRPEGQGLDIQLSHGLSMRLDESIRILREVARGLAVLHRHGLAHGDLQAAHIFNGARGTAITGLGRNASGSTTADLRALGQMAMAMLGGELADSTGWAPMIRIPVELDQIIRRLVSDTAPPSAPDLLAALDHHIGRSVVPADSFLEESSRDARAPGARRRALVLGILGAVALLLLWVLTRFT
jgi:hypothetical protein